MTDVCPLEPGPERDRQRSASSVGLVADLLPRGVKSVEAFDDSAPGELYPEEEAVVARAADRRRREFTTARRCARRALAQLGVPPVPLPPGLRGAPIWPDGLVGSITHCAGYRAAAVARGRDVVALGIDAEPHGPLPPELLDAVAGAEEQRPLADLLRRETVVRWDRLLFSAKEAVYKAWFPLTHRRLDFHEATIGFGPSWGWFTARLLVDGPVLADGRPLGGFRGRWTARRGLIVTAVAVPAAERRPAEPAGG